MSIEARLTELGISLPPAPSPGGIYVPARRAGNLIFVSGQLSLFNGKVQFAGTVGQEIALEQAQEAARLCTVNALSVLKVHLGTLDQVRQIVRLEVFVNSASGFTEQHKVANGASKLLGEVFGEAGRHARVAVGVSELPKGAAVELALIAEKK